MNTGHLGIKTTVCPADRGLSHRGVCNLNPTIHYWQGILQKVYQC